MEGRPLLVSLISQGRYCNQGGRKEEELNGAFFFTGGPPKRRGKRSLPQGHRYKGKKKSSLNTHHVFFFPSLEYVPIGVGERERGKPSREAVRHCFLLPDR